ncbi:hypothetical protein C0991_012514, partial [Blastosporella zonata]
MAHTLVTAIGFLAFKRKTLQRDISIGNVLIRDAGDDDGTEACLIDFDYAKVTNGTKPTLIQTFKSKTPEFDDDEEDVKRILQRRFKKRGLELPHHISDALLLFPDDAANYIKYLLTTLPSSRMNFKAENAGLFGDD